MDDKNILIYVLFAKNYDISDNNIIEGKICKYYDDYSYYYIKYFFDNYSSYNSYEILNNKLPLFLSQYNILYSKENILIENIHYTGYIVSEYDITINNSTINGIIFSINGSIILNNSKINFNQISTSENNIIQQHSSSSSSSDNNESSSSDDEESIPIAELNVEIEEPNINENAIKSIIEEIKSNDDDNDNNNIKEKEIIKKENKIIFMLENNKMSNGIKI